MDAGYSVSEDDKVIAVVRLPAPRCHRGGRGRMDR